MQNPDKIKNKKPLFLDIETATEENDTDFPSEKRKFDLWKDKYCSEKPDDKDELDRYMEKGPLYAEFGRIVCIAIGNENKQEIFYNSDEQALLRDFVNFMDNNVDAKKYVIGGHNIIGFDLPYIIKRLAKYTLGVPEVLRQYTKKPWEVEMIDTMTMRNMTGRRNTSLDVLCEFFGVKPPKDGIDGSQVNKRLWDSFGLGDTPLDFDQKVIDQICNYCKQDVRATAEVYNKIKYLYSL